MSLVAYGASDSGESDSESGEDIAVASKSDFTTNHSVPEISRSTDDGNEPENDVAPHLSADQQGIFHNEGHDVQNLLKELPAPAPRALTTGGAVDELEDVVRPKWSQMKDAPQPPKPKGIKQSVKITIPTLDYDSDDEDRPAKKKLKPSTKKSGLTAMLPAPVHAAKKESNRVLIPYSMTRKKATPSKTRSAATNSLLSGRTTSRADSDSDDDTPVSFFSLDTNEEKPNVLSSVSDVSNLSGVADIGMTSSTDFVGPQPPPSLSGVGRLELPAPMMDSTAPSVGVPLLSGSYSAVDGGQIDYCADNPDSAEFNTGNNYTGTSESCGPELIPDDFMENEQFRRLQGKQKRGREEINLVDVNADDFITTVDVQKNMTVEQNDFSHRKKDNMPTSQQRRKKQITYLAYQAKERELDLKNEWANNRMTKRQTQSKYGF